MKVGSKGAMIISNFEIYSVFLFSRGGVKMKKTISIISGVAVTVAVTMFLINQNPQWINRAVNWLFGQLGIT